MREGVDIDPLHSAHHHAIVTDSRGVSSAAKIDAFGFSGAFAIILAFLHAGTVDTFTTPETANPHAAPIKAPTVAIEPERIDSRHLVSTRRPAGSIFRGQEGCPPAFDVGSAGALGAAVSTSVGGVVGTSSVPPVSARPPIAMPPALFCSDSRS